MAPIFLLYPLVGGLTYKFASPENQLKFKEAAKNFAFKHPALLAGGLLGGLTAAAILPGAVAPVGIALGAYLGNETDKAIAQGFEYLANAGKQTAVGLATGIAEGAGKIYQKGWSAFKQWMQPEQNQTPAGSDLVEAQASAAIEPAFVELTQVKRALAVVISAPESTNDAAIQNLQASILEELDRIFLGNGENVKVLPAISADISPAAGAMVPLRTVAQSLPRTFAPSTWFTAPESGLSIPRLISGSNAFPIARAVTTLAQAKQPLPVTTLKITRKKSDDNRVTVEVRCAEQRNTVRIPVQAEEDDRPRRQSFCNKFTGWLFKGRVSEANIARQIEQTNETGLTQTTREMRSLTLH